MSAATSEDGRLPLEATLRAARDAGRKLLVPYVTGGMDDTWLDHAAGDGRRRCRRGRGRHPVLGPGDGRPHHPARRRRRALARGTTPASVLTELRDVDAGVPLVAMTYYNLVYRPGEARFARCAGRRRRVRGHRPRHPARGGRSVVRRRPTPPASTPSCSQPRPPSDERLARICERSRGFVYGVSLLGMTGSGRPVPDGGLDRQAPEVDSPTCP